MIGRAEQSERGGRADATGAINPRRLLDSALGALDRLLTEQPVEEPRAVTLPAFRAGLRSFIGLDRRLIVPLSILSAIFFFCFMRQTDYDWWWHLRIGQDILRLGALPAVDTYSYTRDGQPFIVHEWLFEALIALAERAFAYRGLVVLMALLVTTTYVIHYLLLRALGVGRALAGLLVAWTLAMSFMGITMRPHLFSTLFLSIELWCLYLYRGGNRRAIWVLPPLMILWVNLHGAWILGVATLGLFIVGEWLNAYARGESANLKSAVVALLAAIAAALINPTGPKLLLYPFSFIGGESATMRYIQEWQPTNFREPMGLAFALSTILLIVLGLRRPRFDYTLALWAVSFTYLGFSAVRHVPLYALVVVPIIAQQLPARWRGPEWPYRENRFTAVANWLLVSIVVGTMAGIVFSNPLAQIGREPNLKGYPSESLAYLRDHPGGKLLNEDGFGGYLIANLPERQIFIDTRVDFYGRDFLEEYIAATRLKPGWRDVLTRYDISLILLAPDSPLITVLRDDPAWRVVIDGDRDGETAVLLERR
jgi:hypothetical protein